MPSRIVFLIVAITTVVSWLAYSAAQSTANSVLTVPEILSSSSPQQNIRLGATIMRVERLEGREGSSLAVVDPRDSGRELTVVYRGALPETVQPSRSAIIEGDYDGSRFLAKTIMMQCPSKYEPPRAQ